MVIKTDDWWHTSQGYYLGKWLCHALNPNHTRNFLNMALVTHLWWTSRTESVTFLGSTWNPYIQKNIFSEQFPACSWGWRCVQKDLTVKRLNFSTHNNYCEIFKFMWHFLHMNEVWHLTDFYNIKRHCLSMTESNFITHKVGIGMPMSRLFTHNV